MHSLFVPSCLTRVVVDDEYQIEIGQLQLVMERIRQSLHHIPAAQREYIATALLNVAVAWVLQREGARHTASILMRLGDEVAGGKSAPSTESAIDLSRMHG